MVRQVPGDFGTQKKPVILDPSQLINRVLWAAGGVATISLVANARYQTSPGEPEFNFTVFITNSDLPTLNNLSLLAEIGPIIPEPGPPTAKIKAEQDFFSYKNRSVFSSHTQVDVFHFVDRGLYNVLTTAGLITSYIDPLFGQYVPFIVDRTITGIFEEGDTPVYGIKDSPDIENVMNIRMVSAAGNTFDPLPGTIAQNLVEEYAGHDDTVTTTTKTKKWRTVSFLNLPRILRTNDSPRNEGKIEFTVEFAGADFRTSMEYAIAVETWRGVKTFTYVSNFADPVLTSPSLVQPSPQKNPVDEKHERSVVAEETRLKALWIKFTIDLKTFKVTATRIPQA